MELHNLEKQFDYGNITEEHKAAVTEVIMLCHHEGLHDLAEKLKFKFQIVLPDRYDAEQSNFVKRCRDLSLDVHIMGYIREGSKEYPIISITEDVRRLSNF